VSYVSSAKIIACPCHGSEFDPSTGSVLRGPASHGLGHITMVEGPDGRLYVQ
jgi:thiosulfate dehydrogenase [quinone] large subunit